MEEKPSFEALAAGLAETGRNLHGRGWALGTSGNFSAVLTPDPLRLLISRSGVDKGEITREQILARGRRRRGRCGKRQAVGRDRGPSRGRATAAGGRGAPHAFRVENITISTIMPGQPI